MKIISWLSLCLIGIIVCLFLWQKIHIDEGMQLIAINNDGKQIAINIFLSQQETIGTTSIALIGAFWALFIYGDHKMNFKTWHGKFLVMQISFLFLCCLMLSFWGQDFIIKRIFYHNTLDFEAPILKFWIYWQRGIFILGLILSGITVLFLRDRSKG